MRWLGKIERLLLILGVLMLALYVAARIHRTVLSSAELPRFKARQAGSPDESRRTVPPSATQDFSLWSEPRIKDYQERLAEHFAPAIAVLRIPKIHAEVPILEGTDDVSLNRGVGHVVGTANPGENGNMAIAGHRDGFFRGLKDVSLGDSIEMITPEQTEIYIIDRISVVDCTDLSVLGPRPHASLTLVTCYPFYFIGSAPKRYIVQASLAESAGANTHTAEQEQSEPGTVNQQAVPRGTI
jgi:sortase A